MNTHAYINNYFFPRTCLHIEKSLNAAGSSNTKSSSHVGIFKKE